VWFAMVYGQQRLKSELEVDLRGVFFIQRNKRSKKETIPLPEREQRHRFFTEHAMLLSFGIVSMYGIDMS